MIKSKILLHLKKLEEDEHFQFHPKTAKKLIDWGYVSEQVNQDGIFHWISYNFTCKGIEFLNINKTLSQGMTNV